MDDNRFYSPEELAELLGVNVMTIYRHIKKGSLSAVKMSRDKIIISKEDLEDFLKKHKTK